MTTPIVYQLALEVASNMNGIKPSSMLLLQVTRSILVLFWREGRWGEGGLVCLKKKALAAVNASVLVRWHHTGYLYQNGL
jgi:hypothetical protein